ncbi:MAG: hypothetical protein JXJ17_16610 [Anaerolineae bacterium]|nr:hypothetical protein [Anaerolineae bacterium]
MSDQTRRHLSAARQPLIDGCAAIWGRVEPVLDRWWANPLLSHARRLNPLSIKQQRKWWLPAAGGLAGLAVVFWIAGHTQFGRLPGAILTGLSLGAVLIPALAAPMMAAAWVAKRLDDPANNPRQLSDLAPESVTWGLALTVLWRLRWPILIGLAFTPALVIGVLRLDMADFIVWRESARALGTATDASRAAWHLGEGRVPVFRLLMRAISAGLLPWLSLPLMAISGAAAALWLEDSSLSMLAALLAELPLIALIGAAWSFLSLTPYLAGVWEVFRLIVYGGFAALIVWASDRLNRLSAQALAADES